MKILIIPSWYSTDERPTLGSFFREQAFSILEEGVDVRVAYTELRNPKYILKDFKSKKKKGFDFINDDNLKTYRDIQYNIPPRVSRLMELRFYFGLKKIIKNLLREGWKPDLIHVHSFYPAGYGVLKLYKELKIPYIITEHSTGFSKKSYKKYQLNYLKEILDSSSKIIAVGEGLKKDLENHTKNKIKIIPNMVDCNFFKREKLKNQSNDFVFFSLAYLTHKKGFDLLLEAFAKTFKGQEKVKLKIGGDGEEKGKLINMSKYLGIDKQVEFLGSLTREKVIYEMNRCDAFVLASRFETFGVVFIEALACGKPIIVPNIEGPQEIVNINNGLVFKKEDIEDLSEKLLKMLTEYERYDSKNIKRDCYSLYDKEIIAKRIVNIYKDIIF